MIRFDLNTDRSRFDLTAMTQEWADFTQTQCGYEKLEAELVARLSFLHATLFATELGRHGVMWDEIEGHFVMADSSHGVAGGFPFTREELDLIWSNAFETVNEQFDVVDTALYDEQQHGLV